jgi:hypothetical protein
VQFGYPRLVDALLNNGAIPDLNEFEVADDSTGPKASGPKKSNIVALINKKPKPLNDAFKRILCKLPDSAYGSVVSGPIDCSLLASAPRASAAMPSAATPSVATPSVAMPSAATPSVAMPSVATPSVATPSVPTEIPLYLLDYDGEQNTFPNNGIDNAQIAVKLFKGPHRRSDQEPRDNSFVNPVQTGMKITWGTSGSATVLPGSFAGVNASDSMVHNIMYINLDKAVDPNAPVFYLKPASGGFRRKASKSRRAISRKAKRKAKYTKRR